MSLLAVASELPASMCVAGTGAQRSRRSFRRVSSYPESHLARFRASLRWKAGDEEAEEQQQRQGVVPAVLTTFFLSATIVSRCRPT